MKEPLILHLNQLQRDYDSYQDNPKSKLADMISAIETYYEKYLPAMEDLIAKLRNDYGDIFDAEHKDTHDRHAKNPEWVQLHPDWKFPVKNSRD